MDELESRLTLKIEKDVTKTSNVCDDYINQVDQLLQLNQNI